jgi:hypothetical protein
MVSCVSEPRSLRKNKKSSKTNGSRAFRGLLLVFILTFVNLVGLILTITALGGLEPWTRWQFMGLFGVIEAAAGLSNIVSPNIWRLPAAEIKTSHRTPVRLAATTMLLPHWGGAARAGAGATLVLVAGFSEGWGAESMLLPLFIGMLVIVFLGLAAVIARIGVEYADTDTVQFVVRWRGKEREMEPITISAAVQQFVLGILTIPAVTLLEPVTLYGPELRPSPGALLAVSVAASVSVVATWFAWSGRIQWHAPREQQVEAERNA